MPAPGWTCQAWFGLPGPWPRKLPQIEHLILQRLALHPGAPVHAQVLYRLVWPERRDSGVPRSLSVAIYRVRQALGDAKAPWMIPEKTARGYVLLPLDWPAQQWPIIRPRFALVAAA